VAVVLKNIVKLFEPNYSNLDAKLWVQKVILKKYLKKINNPAQIAHKDALNNTHTLIIKH